MVSLSFSCRPVSEPADAPAALPGGVVEYGEAPEAAAVREAYEETGLRAEVVRELGRWFDPRFPYGPMLSIMFEARVVGGQPRGSHEGEVRVVRPENMPRISPSRSGSQRAFAAWSSRRPSER